jgi:plastocyanin
MTLLTRRNALRLAAASVALPLAATMARADGHATNHTVVIKDFSFTPANLTIKAGDTVTWVNQDDTQHSAWESANNAFDTGLLATGQSAALTFASAGSFNYRCRPHGNMRGTITIS